MASDRALSSQLTICFIAPKAHSLFIEDGDIQFGGAEVQLYTLAVALGVQFSSNTSVDAIVVDAGQCSIQWASNVRLLASYRLSDSLPIRVWKMTKALLRSPAFVYIQRTMTPFTPALAILLRAVGKRFVYMLASDREVDPPGLLKRLMVRTSVQAAAMCIYQNEAQSASLTRIKRSNAQQLSSSVPYPVPTSIPSHGERSYILWIGRVTRIKQAELVLELAAMLSHIPFVIIGSSATGEEEYRESVFAAARGLSNVSVVPGVSLWKTKSYYETARALVNTSAGEGFPATFAQAWAAGTPVVSLNVDPDNLLKTNKLGWYCANSVSEVARRISDLWHDSDLFQGYSTRCLVHAQRNHDASVNAKRFLHLVDTLK